MRTTHTPDRYDIHLVIHIVHHPHPTQPWRARGSVTLFRSGCGEARDPYEAHPPTRLDRNVIHPARRTVHHASSITTDAPPDEPTATPRNPTTQCRRQAMHHRCIQTNAVSHGSEADMRERSEPRPQAETYRQTPRPTQRQTIRRRGPPGSSPQPDKVAEQVVIHTRPAGPRVRSTTKNAHTLRLHSALQPLASAQVAAPCSLRLRTDEQTHQVVIRNVEQLSKKKEHTVIRNREAGEGEA